MKINIKMRLLIAAILLVGVLYMAFDWFFYSGELIGIKGTDTYHRDKCQFVKKSSAKDLIFFEDLEATAYSDYRPCKTCNPPNNYKEVQAFNIEQEERKKIEKLNAEKEKAEQEKLQIEQEKLKIEQERIKAENEKIKKEKDKNDALKLLLEYRDSYSAGITHWGIPGTGIPLKIYVGLINKEYIPKDSKLYIKDITKFLVYVAAGEFGSSVYLSEDEIDSIKSNGYISIDNDFIKKMIEEDNTKGISVDWYYN